MLIGTLSLTGESLSSKPVHWLLLWFLRAFLERQVKGQFLHFLRVAGQLEVGSARSASWEEEEVP